MFNAIASIDGGGSKTSAVIMTRDGSVRHLAPVSGCNPQDGSDWLLAFNTVLGQIPVDAYTVLGMPGHGEIPANDRMVAEVVRAKIGKHHIIMNDVELAYRGAFGDEDGVLVLSGTGSMAMGRANGNTVRAGGWGYYFSDEGSGHWIGQRALQEATRIIDAGTTESPFVQGLTSRINAPDHRFGLLEWVAADPSPRARIAEIARYVDAMEQAGDPVAQRILNEAAMHLAGLARTVANQCGFVGDLTWCPAGSVFESACVRSSVSAELGPSSKPNLSPLGGGLLMAAKAANWPDHQNIHSDIEKRLAG